MEKNITAESGLQLIARLYKGPSLLHLDDILFPGGPEPGDIVQISGPSSVGKSLLLMKFMTKSLLPKSYEGVEIGGLESGVILISTDHSISIVKLVFLMEQFVYNVSMNHCDKEKTLFLKRPEHIEKIVLESLRRLIVLKTYSSLQLDMNFNSLEKILSGNPNISLVILDSLTAYYWSDITSHKSIKKMDLYLKVIIEKLKKCLEEFKMVIVFTTQEYFQYKQSEYSLNLIKHKVELKKKQDSDNFLACIDSQKAIYQYSLSKKGFTKLDYECQKQFERLANALESYGVDLKINAANRIIGSLEVTRNDVVEYSKLKNLNFSDFESDTEVVKEIFRGELPK